MSKNDNFNSLPSQQHEKRSPTETVINAISRFRIPIITIGVIAIAAVAGGFVYQGIVESRLEKSAEVLTQLETSYNAWRNADESERPMHYDAFMNEYDMAVTEYEHMYTGQLAQFMRAQISFTEEAYAAAAESFLKIANDYPENHLAGISALNAAVAYEEDGDTQAALDAYDLAASSFSETSPEAPRAAFARARLHESIDLQQALDSYETVVNRFPDSDWANLSESRILTIQNLE